MLVIETAYRSLTAKSRILNRDGAAGADPATI
jgi:hypothetical protein